MNLTFQSLVISSLVAFAFSASAAWTPSTEAEKKGLAIAVQSKQANTGWGNSSSEMEMILINNHGDKSTRKVRSLALEVKNDGDKSLSIFDSPKDVKGTAFLTFTHIKKNDDQWIYLPALKRVKRISSKNKSGPFMGSEFAFEDLSSFEIPKYAYEYIGDEKVNGKTVSKVKFIPQDQYSGYKYFYNWFSQIHFQPVKTEFYDRKGALLKTLTASDFRQFYNGFWRAHQLHVVNHQKKRETQLFFNNYKFNIGLKDSDFNKRKLKKIR